jgi:hypothetical protein
MERLWIVLCEITVAPGDFESGATVGFINIVTWAEGPSVAELKIRNYLKTFDWHVIEVERVDLVDENYVYGEEMSDLIDRAMGNSMAIILGTFHSYKTN